MTPDHIPWYSLDLVRACVDDAHVRGAKHIETLHPAPGQVHARPAMVAGALSTAGRGQASSMGMKPALGWTQEPGLDMCRASGSCGAASEGGSSFKALESLLKVIIQSQHPSFSANLTCH